MSRVITVRPMVLQEWVAGGTASTGASAWKGPDIAWLAIDADSARRLEDGAGVVFHRIDVGGRKKVRAESSVWCCGYVARDEGGLDRQDTPAVLIQIWQVMPELAGEVDEGSLTVMKDEEGWEFGRAAVSNEQIDDWYERGVERGQGPWQDPPERWRPDRDHLRGMSGSGVWLAMRKEGEEEWRWRLAGIAFRQEERDAVGTKRIVYQLVNDRVKNLVDAG